MDSVFDAAVRFAKERLKDFDAGHDWLHAERVLNLSRKLWKLEGAGDLQVIALSAVLHDIADMKFHDGSDGDGGKLAVDFLTGHGLNSEKALHVGKIIDNLSFSKRKEAELVNTIEFKIVQDADRLDAMGAIGIARAFSFGGYKNRPMYGADCSSTIDHFYEKLFLLRDLMNTKSGKQIARERHKIMEDYVDQFLRECKPE